MHDGGPFQAAIIDSTGTQQAAAIMQGPNTYIMTYTSPSSANTFQITALAGGGSITLTQATFKQLKYVPGTTTISLCNQSNDNYRFGFNGKEKDNQWAGIGNSLDFGDRMEDSRSGRFRSKDPLLKKFPSESPYAFGGNNPIFYVDKGGDKKTTFFDYVNEQTGVKYHLKMVTPGLYPTAYDNEGSIFTTYDWQDYAVKITFHVDKTGKSKISVSQPILSGVNRTHTFTKDEHGAMVKAGEIREDDGKVKDTRSFGGWIGTSDEGGGEDNKYEPTAGPGSKYVDYGTLVKTMGALQGFTRENPGDAISLLEDLNNSLEMGTDFATDESKKGIINVDASGTKKSNIKVTEKTNDTFQCDVPGGCGQLHVKDSNGNTQIGIPAPQGKKTSDYPTAPNSSGQ